MFFPYWTRTGHTSHSEDRNVKYLVTGTIALPHIGPFYKIKHIASVSGCLSQRKKFYSFRTGLESSTSTVETIKVQLKLPMHEPRVLLR